MRWEKFCKISAFIITILIIVFALSGCCLFKHAPTPIPQPEVRTITNTVIQQVKVNDWLVTGSVLLMGVGVFGFLNGWKQGISLVAAAGAVLGISLVLKAYGAILVFAGAVCIAGFVGWQIYIRVKALHEALGKEEQIKALASRPASVLPEMVALLDNQSPITKKLVAGIRKKINGVTK